MGSAYLILETLIRCWCIAYETRDLGLMGPVWVVGLSVRERRGLREFQVGGEATGVRSVTRWCLSV
jgi:hypothetical protein